MSTAEATADHGRRLAEDFEPTAQAIRNWVRQADLDAGKRTDGLTTDDREELARLGPPNG